MEISDFESSFMHLVNFLLKLQGKNVKFFRRLLNNLHSFPNILNIYFNIIFKKLKNVIKLTKSSSTLQMPSTDQEKILNLGLNILLSYMHLHDFKEFLALNLQFERLLQLFMYLQNLVSYNFLLSSPETSSKSTKSEIQLVDPQKISQIIQTLLEYNELSSFIPENHFIMCKLNSYLYDQFSLSYTTWGKDEFNHFYNMIKLFPHCFTFEKRVEFFYHALTLNSQSNGECLFVNVRRDRIVEDGIKTFTVLLL